MRQSKNYSFKKLIIEPKRKYVYITIDEQKIKAEKNKLEYEINFNYDFSCKCGIPYRDKKDLFSRLCKKCNGIIY